MLMTMILYIVSILNSLYTQTRYMYRLRVVALVVANIPYKIHLSFRDLKLERRTLCTALWLHGFNHSPRTYIHKTKRKKNNNITIRMANSRLWKLLDRIHVCAMAKTVDFICDSITFTLINTMCVFNSHMNSFVFNHVDLNFGVYFHYLISPYLCLLLLL